jgi:hypothetical protein
MRQDEGSAAVDVEDIDLLIEIVAEAVAWVAEARVVDQQADLDPVQGRQEHRQEVPLGQIQGDDPRLDRVILLQGVRQLPEPAGAPRDERDVHPSLRQLPGEGGPDARRGAGDQRPGSVSLLESTHHPSTGGARSTPG